MELYRGRRLWVEKRKFSLPDGRQRDGVVIHPGDAVVVLPREDDIFFLIRQWRFAINSWIYEAPAGTIEEGEDPSLAAHRELIEETGFSAGKFIPRGFIYTTPGISDEKLWLFEAEDLTPNHDHSPDEDEIIELVRFSSSEIISMIKKGEIIDAKTIAIIMKCIGCEV